MTSAEDTGICGRAPAGFLHRRDQSKCETWAAGGGLRVPIPGLVPAATLSLTLASGFASAGRGDSCPPAEEPSKAVAMDLCLPCTGSGWLDLDDFLIDGTEPRRAPWPRAGSRP